MSSSSPSSDPTPPTAPTASALAGSDDSTWPGWIGGIGIGIGALTVLTVCCAALGMAMPAVMSGGAMGGFRFPPPPGAMLGYMAVDGLLGLGLGIAALVGGIGAIRRRASGVRLLRRYAIVRVALALPFLVGAMWMMGPQSEWTAQIARATNEWKESQKPPFPVTEAERKAETPTEPAIWQRGITLLFALTGLAFPVAVLVVTGKPSARSSWERWEA